MKTFGELQKGDYIYYYDHGFIHSQLVHDIQQNIEESKWTDWSGNEHIQTRKTITIKAGKNCTYTIYEWTINRSSDIINCIRRFSCIEAANSYLEKMINRDDHKVEYYTKQLRKYTNLRNRHAHAAWLISTQL